MMVQELPNDDSRQNTVNKTEGKLRTNSDFDRDDSTNLIIDEQGMPLIGDSQILDNTRGTLMWKKTTKKKESFI